MPNYASAKNLSAALNKSRNFVPVFNPASSWEDITKFLSPSHSQISTRVVQGRCLLCSVKLALTPRIIYLRNTSCKFLHLHVLFCKFSIFTSSGQSIYRWLARTFYTLMWCEAGSSKQTLRNPFRPCFFSLHLNQHFKYSLCPRMVSTDPIPFSTSHVRFICFHWSSSFETLLWVQLIAIQFRKIR